MRWRVRIVQSLAIAVWAVSALPASAQQAARGGAPAPAAKKSVGAAPLPPIDPGGKKMEQLLKAWAERSTQLKSLDVEIDETIDPGGPWGDSIRLKGRALFKSPNLAWIDFQKKLVGKDKAVKFEPYERIICTGKEVWHYRCDVQQINIYDPGNQSRQRALQEGPLPFLFNFRAEDAKRRYRMSLLREDEKSYYIQILPLEQIDKECFSQAIIGLDKKLFLPRGVMLHDIDQKGRKVYLLKKISPNAKVMDENFKGQKLPAPWTVHRNEPGKDTPRQAPTRGPAAAVGKAIPRTRAR